MKTFAKLLPALLIVAACGHGGIGLVGSPAWHMTASAEDKKRYYTEECIGFGFKANTPEMARCIQRQSNESRSRASASMDSALSDYSRRTSGVGAPTTTGTAFLESEYTQGFNKVCVYDRLGSVDTKVISATSICPLTM